MTCARAKAIQEKVTSLLSTFYFDTPLDGMLVTADTLCVVRYIPQEASQLRSSIKTATRSEEGGLKNQVEKSTDRTTASTAGTTGHRYYRSPVLPANYRPSTVVRLLAPGTPPLDKRK